MSTPHLTDAEIAEAPASLTDVRRRHLDECVRCRLRVSRYRAFVAAPEHVPSRDLADAEARLTAFLDERTGAGLAPARPAPTRSGRRAGWLPEWLGGSAWQPAFALSAIAVIGAGVLWISAERTREARVLRGTVARSAIAVAPAVPLESGGLSLHWTPVAGADRYELRFYAPELRELRPAATTADTSFTLDAGTLPGSAGGDTLVVSIAAMRGEALLARSDPRPMILPAKVVR